MINKGGRANSEEGYILGIFQQMNWHLVPGAIYTITLITDDGVVVTSRIADIPVP